MELTCARKGSLASRPAGNDDKKLGRACALLGSRLDAFLGRCPRRWMEGSSKLGRRWGGPLTGDASVAGRAVLDALVAR